jgi:hypothetical protein
MPGKLLRLVPKRKFDFSSVAVGQSEEVVLVQGIDVSQWREVALLVRTHTNSFTGSVGQIEIKAYLDGRTAEDPKLLFASASAQVSILIDSTTPAPSYQIGNCGTNIGALLKISATGTKASSTAAIVAALSIDMTVKSGVPPI